jgi:hypothetical protein
MVWAPHIRLRRRWALWTETRPSATRQQTESHQAVICFTFAWPRGFVHILRFNPRRLASTTSMCRLPRSVQRRDGQGREKAWSEFPDGWCTGHQEKRQAEHIEEGYEHRGVSKHEAARRAWDTVNKEAGGGKRSGIGRGKRTSHARLRKGDKLGGAAAANIRQVRVQPRRKRPRVTRKRKAAYK